MTDQWRELKETIEELRDNDGIATQQEVCKFLANYMGVLEKQMIDQIDQLLEIIDDTSKDYMVWSGIIDTIRSRVLALIGGKQE